MKRKGATLIDGKYASCKHGIVNPIGAGPPTMQNTKAEILAYAKAHDIEVDNDEIKQALLDTITDFILE